MNESEQQRVQHIWEALEVEPDNTELHELLCDKLEVAIQDLEAAIDKARKTLLNMNR